MATTYELNKKSTGFFDLAFADQDGDAVTPTAAWARIDAPKKVVRARTEFTVAAATHTLELTSDESRQLGASDQTFRLTIEYEYESDGETKVGTGWLDFTVRGTKTIA